MALYSTEHMINNTYWYEESRGNKSLNKYPPCYNICAATRHIYHIFEKYNLINDYYVLLNVYSVILCQKTHAEKRNQEMLLERLRDLKNSGGNELDKNAQNIVQQHTRLHNNQIGFLLVLATSIIIKELKKLDSDSRILDIDKQLIYKHNETFYTNHYDTVNKKLNSI